jgi:hypothetical protein
LGTKRGRESLPGVDARMYKYRSVYRGGVLHVDMVGREVYCCLFGIRMLVCTSLEGAEFSYDHILH